MECVRRSGEEYTIRSHTMGNISTPLPPRPFGFLNGSQRAGRLPSLGQKQNEVSPSLRPVSVPLFYPMSPSD